MSLLDEAGGGLPLGPVVSLAREVGFDLPPGAANADTLTRYVLGLVSALRERLDKGGIEPPPHERAGALVHTSEAIIRADPGAIVGHADAMVRHIAGIDDYDGWPCCPWLHALKCCCLAVKFGIAHPENSRWPAHAGGYVADMILGHRGRHNAQTAEERKTWLRERLADAVAGSC
jgi:hypothetical protein